MCNTYYDVMDIWHKQSKLLPSEIWWWMKKVETSG